jgi:hypothetical protein
MIKRLISQDRIKELGKQKQNETIIIEKLKLAGCSEKEIKNLIKGKEN